MMGSQSLSDYPWDVVICGTGLVESLLALSLSRSDKKILHLDRNAYYGGQEAAFSLPEAEEWAVKVNSGKEPGFSKAAIDRAESEEAGSKLGNPRSYTLSLYPQILYAQTQILSALVSSRVHSQLEFQAVGSFWILDHGRLKKIPSRREDVFHDPALSMRDKRALTKVLRQVLQDSVAESGLENASEQSLEQMLTRDFGLSPQMHKPLLSLALSYEIAASTESTIGLQRVRRHMRSIGAFGPGFGAVTVKYGGNSEIAQVACRACAVGGGVYALGKGVKHVGLARVDAQTSDLLDVELSDGEHIQTKFLVGTDAALSSLESSADLSDAQTHEYSFLIAIVSSTLEQLLPPTAENGPIPAACVVATSLPPDGDGGGAIDCPAYFLIHSADTGECPSGQGIIYASARRKDPLTCAKLTVAMRSLLESVGGSEAVKILWSMSYERSTMSTSKSESQGLPNPGDKVISLRAPTIDLSFDDDLLQCVRLAWKSIIGDTADENTFLRFDENSVAQGGED